VGWDATDIALTDADNPAQAFNMPTFTAKYEPIGGGIPTGEDPPDDKDTPAFSINPLLPLIPIIPLIPLIPAVPLIPLLPVIPLAALIIPSIPLILKQCQALPPDTPAECDPVAPAEPPTTSPSVEKPPKTGDDRLIVPLMLGLMGVSFAGAAVMLARRRKEEEFLAFGHESSL